MFERLRPGYYALIALAAFEFSLAFVFGQADIWNYFTTNGLKRLMVPIGALFPLLWLGGVTFTIVHRRSDRPTRALWRMIVSHRRWLARGAFFAVMVVLLARSFSSYKASIPLMNPYWADPWLADLDQQMFGVDPWRLTHAFIGKAGTIFIDRAYAMWFIMMFIMLGWFCFTRNPKLQIRGLMSYLLSWFVLGNVTATWLSSVGPCFYQKFYQDDRYAPLMSRIQDISSEHYLIATGAMRYLSSSVGQDRPAGGISAMPSLHVTIAVLTFLVTTSYSRRITLKVVAGLYAATIWIGSVHLGWHYASDGMVGIVVVCLIWWGTGRWVDWLEVREHKLRPAQDVTPLPATS